MITHWLRGWPKFRVWDLHEAFIYDATNTPNEQYEANQNHHTSTFCPQAIFYTKEIKMIEAITFINNILHSMDLYIRDSQL